MSKADFGEIRELRADQSLLNHDFENYLLSSRKVEMRKVELPAAVHRPSPSADQWGFQHVKVFSSAAVLVPDLFVGSDEEHHVYVFTDNGALVKVVYKSNLANFTSLSEVATVGFPLEKAAAFPPSLVFADRKHAVVSNGGGRLVIFKTHDRVAENQRWTEVFSYSLMSDSTAENFVLRNTVDQAADGVPFVVLDCRSQEESRLSIILQAVVSNKTADGEEADGKQPPFSSRLVWLDVELPDGALPNVRRHREATYAAHLELATLNATASELVTVGPTTPRFFFDSEKPIVPPSEEEAEGKKEAEGKAADQPAYVWTQDAEEITATFGAAEAISRKDVEYKLTSDSISVVVKGVTLLQGPLEQAVHLDASTWSIVDGKNLQITLFKVRGHFWRELVKGDKRGLYQSDPQQIAQALESLSKFTSEEQAISARGAQSSTLNADQLEEVDNAGDEAAFICWTDGDSHRCMQTFDASCSQFLFDTRLSAGGPRTVATRQDNDGIVWSLDGVDLEHGRRIVHKHTLNAFGYAGHSQKLFAGCSPDGGYATVVHASNHAFVYLQNVPVAAGSQLRNRRTEKNHRNIAEQYVINTAALFDQTVESPNFVGFAAANSVLFLLTAKQLMACHVRG
ncbi:NudC domain-containing protein 1 [Aphelenchoides fujianensis]|nr:NudC domain-containing protein 1 [Aphelenchoides fujianensis]